jgi:hypothetical protein
MRRFAAHTENFAVRGGRREIQAVGLLDGGAKEITYSPSPGWDYSAAPIS